MLVYGHWLDGDCYVPAWQDLMTVMLACTVWIWSSSHTLCICVKQARMHVGLKCSSGKSPTTGSVCPDACLPQAYHYLSSIAVKEGKVFALFVRSPTKVRWLADHSNSGPLVQLDWRTAQVGSLWHPCHDRSLGICAELYAKGGVS